MTDPAGDRHDPFAAITLLEMSHADRTLLVLGGDQVVGELGEVWRYSYWSDQKMQDIAADNAIDLDRRWRTTLRTPSFGFMPQAEVSRKRGALLRHEVATKVETAVGQLAVADFVTPPPARYVKGCGDVTFSIYTRWSDGGKKRKSRGKAVIVGMPLWVRSYGL